MNFAIRYLTKYEYDGEVVDNLNALRVKPHAPRRVDRLRLRGVTRQLGVRERGHQARHGNQRRDEPPSAGHAATRGGRLGKLSWRHVSVWRIGPTASSCNHDPPPEQHDRDGQRPINQNLQPVER